MKQAALGIDIGGTNTVMGLVDKDGLVIKETSIPTKTHPDYTIYMNSLCDAIQNLVDTYKSQFEIIGIGVGAPNGNYYNGTIEFAPNLKFEGIVPVVDYLKKSFDFPYIILTNDANAAAIGEMIYGGAKGMKDFIMITLGTGVGSGIVVNGEMVYGHDGFAGEIGHTIFDPNGRDCGCGRKGCLETYTSAPGLKRTVFELLSVMVDPSELRGISFNDLSALQIDKAARNGDAIALEAFEYTGEVLGIKLADAVAHTSPEAIFLFGGLAQAGDLIFEPVKRNLEDNLLNIYKNKVKVLPSELPPGEAAVLGASALVWKEFGV
ncbi:MAG: ROK family protein [Bacteroidales bacterium]|nr:ROK family protein [Bacteroidales bacterium]MCF8402774.1 ROK family protein [Bacteroidales bacterium]